MQYNLNNPAIKRILRELKEFEKDPSNLFVAKPLEDEIFEWHFTIRGPPDTPFAGGVYHGRIILPPEYPFKPPNIVLLTPNGRFEVGKKICLSVSAHHPEEWQPSWSILVAIIAFMPTKGEGAVGALDYSPEERIELAKKSKSWSCARCGSHNSTALPDISDEQLKAESSVMTAAASAPGMPVLSQVAPTNTAPTAQSTLTEKTGEAQSTSSESSMTASSSSLLSATSSATTTSSSTTSVPMPTSPSQPLPVQYATTTAPYGRPYPPSSPLSLTPEDVYQPPNPLGAYTPHHAHAHVHSPNCTMNGRLQQHAHHCQHNHQRAHVHRQDCPNHPQNVHAQPPASPTIAVATANQPSAQTPMSPAESVINLFILAFLAVIFALLMKKYYV